jgi:hypothetical protein
LEYFKKGNFSRLCHGTKTITATSKKKKKLLMTSEADVVVTSWRPMDFRCRTRSDDVILTRFKISLDISLDNEANSHFSQRSFSLWSEITVCFTVLDYRSLSAEV